MERLSEKYYKGELTDQICYYRDGVLEGEFSNNAHRFVYAANPCA
jgi:hypothetical protein